MRRLFELDNKTNNKKILKNAYFIIDRYVKIKREERLALSRSLTSSVDRILRTRLLISSLRNAFLVIIKESRDASKALLDKSVN